MKVLSDIIFFIAYRLVRYRRNVTRTNLSHAYPNLSDDDRNKLEKQYYHHLADLVVEGLHNLYATPRTILQHYHFVNRELVNAYYEKGQSVILMSSHYNNWEYMVSSLNFQLRHLGIGVGKPLDNKSIAGYVTRRRSRFGTEIVDHTNVRQTIEYYQSHHVPAAYMMLSDQSPSNPHKSYWTMFMHQETPFLYGAEYFARKYDLPVIYYEVIKKKRGHYDVTFSLLCDQPNAVPQYTIVARYVHRLAQTIDSAPQYWLWSHKRWKRKRPADMPIIKGETTNS